MEPMTLGGGKNSNTGGIQEKFRQPHGRYPLIYIPALSRGLDSMALQAPSNSIILWLYDIRNAIFCGCVDGRESRVTLTWENKVNTLWPLHLSFAHGEGQLYES